MNVSPTQPRSLTQKRHVRVLGVPMDIGGAGPGASGGPESVREAGLLRAIGAGVLDLGDINILMHVVVVAVVVVVVVVVAVVSVLLSFSLSLSSWSLSSWSSWS